MIIDKSYIIRRIQELAGERQSELLKNKIEERNLYRKKLGFPVWLRKIIFHPFDPVYSIMKQYRQTEQEKDTTVFYPLHQYSIDFIDYCFDNDIRFDVSEYFDQQDMPGIIEFVDNRIKCFLAGFLRKSLSDAAKKDKAESRAMQKAIKYSDGFYTLNLGGQTYYLPKNVYGTNVFTYHYGIKELPENVRKYIKGKVFLDVGALYGDASLMMLQYEPQYIYAYEPVKENFQLLCKTIEKNAPDKIKAVNKGLGDIPGSMDITTEGGSSSVNDNLQKTVPTETVEIAVIDEECKDIQTGLIKMDVEGFEYFVIKGGLDTIKRDKPVLLISVYHTGKDFFEIPPMIRSCCKEYKFKYVDLAPCDTLSEKVVMAYID